VSIAAGLGVSPDLHAISPQPGCGLAFEKAVQAFVAAADVPSVDCEGQALEEVSSICILLSSFKASPGTGVRPEEVVVINTIITMRLPAKQREQSDCALNLLDTAGSKVRLPVLKGWVCFACVAGCVTTPPLRDGWPKACTVCLLFDIARRLGTELELLRRRLRASANASLSRLRSASAAASRASRAALSRSSAIRFSRRSIS